MIESIIIQYLDDVLSVPVAGEIPKEPPASFCIVEKTGSDRVNMISTATLAVQSYAPTIAQAAQLNDRVKMEMLHAVELDNVSRVEINADYNYTDPTTKRPRYQAVFDVVYMEEY